MLVDILLIPFASVFTTGYIRFQKFYFYHTVHLLLKKHNLPLINFVQTFFITKDRANAPLVSSSASQISHGIYNVLGNFTLLQII